MKATVTIIALAALALVATSAEESAHATPSQVQLDFFQAGVPIAYSDIYTAGQDISFTETYGGYTLLISGDSNNLYGVSALGDNPYLSLTIQVSNVGTNPPAPIRIGMTITGLDAVPGTNIAFDSHFSTIFKASTANFHTYYDPDDQLFGRTEDLSRFDALGNGSIGVDQTLTEQLGGPYSMSFFVTYTPGANSHPTMSAQLGAENVPEPVSLALLGAGLTGLGVVRRRRGA